MQSNPTISGITQYLTAIQDLQRQVVETQAAVLDQIATHMLATVRNGKRIFVFGTGHSHMLAEEAFYRAGGLAAAVPIFMTDLMLHENPDLSSRLERTAGIAAILLDQYQCQPGEMLFVYSNSGVNHLPVEIAMLARQRGLAVVGICSIAYAKVAPLSAIGQRLDEVADYVVDNLGVPGDGLVPLEGSDWRVGPSSTILGAFIWNSLITEVLTRMHQAGEQAPVYASFNMRGAAAHNKDLLQEWGSRNPQIQGWLRRG